MEVGKTRLMQGCKITCPERAHLTLPAMNTSAGGCWCLNGPPQEVCAVLLISESHRSRPLKGERASKTQDDYLNVNTAKPSVDGFNKTHPD